MTLLQEATEIMAKMPLKSQQVVVELLRVMSVNTASTETKKSPTLEFKRTGKSRFNLPADFDEHFDDMNDEIALLFSGEDL